MTDECQPNYDQCSSTNNLGEPCSIRRRTGSTKSDVLATTTTATNEEQTQSIEEHYESSKMESSKSLDNFQSVQQQPNRQSSNLDTDDDNQQLRCRRRSCANSNTAANLSTNENDTLLDSSEQQDNQTTTTVTTTTTNQTGLDSSYFTDTNTNASTIECDDAAVMTKEAIPKYGGLEGTATLSETHTATTSVRSRFASSPPPTTTTHQELSSKSSSSSIECKHHLGHQSICQTFADEVRELKLLAHAALPEWLKDNEFLYSSHRPPIPCIATCFKSVFSIHSETVNIWTHLIGSLIIVAITFWFFLRPSNVPYTWQKVLVFLLFFISAVSCMTFSWLYHTLYCHSVQMNKLFSKLDYSGIAILILGSFVPWLYYGFYCDQTHMIFYIASMVVLSTCCIIFSLWEKFAAPTYRPIRTATFIGLGLSGVVPFVHGVLNHGLEYTRFPYIASVALLYIGGALIYALRVPERFLPGKLDIWGHSHQIFHVLVVIAAVVHYNGIITMAEDRHYVHGECHTHTSLGGGSAGASI